MIVFGVDPGSLRTGYGVIETDGHRHRLLAQGVLAPQQGSIPERLRFIYTGIVRLLSEWQPDCLAVEDVFHAVNVRSALTLGHVRGVILLAGCQAGIPVSAHPPATVKLEVTGSGRASKHQVALMVSRLLSLTDDTPAGDAADALAVAVCQAHLNGIPRRARLRPRRDMTLPEARERVHR